MLRLLKWLAFVGYTFCYGLWLLVRHPVLFYKFSKVYKRYETSIDDADDFKESGFMSLPRKDRRELIRKANKFVGHA